MGFVRLHRLDLTLFRYFAQTYRSSSYWSVVRSKDATDGFILYGELRSICDDCPSFHLEAYSLDVLHACGTTTDGRRTQQTLGHAVNMYLSETKITAHLHLVELKKMCETHTSKYKSTNTCIAPKVGELA